MKSVNAYLNFDGNCEEAFNFYKSIFGGEFSYIGKFKDMPANSEIQASPEEMERVMHVSLPIGEHTMLMGSDSSNAFGHNTLQGNNFNLSVNADSFEEAKKIYDALSDGGKITMPLEKTFWGAYFGMLIDKFGIYWMVNCETAEHKDFEKEHGA